MSKKPVLALTGTDGNAFHILARAQRIALRNQMDWDAIKREAMSSNYDNLLQTMMKYFEVI